MDRSALEKLAGRGIGLVVERRQGLTYARIAGIKASHGKVLVFVDDDNELDENYLHNALQICEDHPDLGTCGGVAEGRLEIGVSKHKQSLLPHLGVRDNGHDRIEGPADEWGLWEPIGAGLVIRREVGEKFIEFVEQNELAGDLGRIGNSLMSGEDTLITRLASQLNYRCSYEPALKLRHYIPRQRLSYSYLMRLLYGHGQSFVVVSSLIGQSVDAPKKRWISLLRNFAYRCRNETITVAIGMVCWDLGFRARYYSSLDRR